MIYTTSDLDDIRQTLEMGYDIDPSTALGLLDEIDRLNLLIQREREVASLERVLDEARQNSR